MVGKFGYRQRGEAGWVSKHSAVDVNQSSRDEFGIMTSQLVAVVVHVECELIGWYHGSL